MSTTPLGDGAALASGTEQASATLPRRTYLSEVTPPPLRCAQIYARWSRWCKRDLVLSISLSISRGLLR